jgi:hypothetical protein
MKKPELDPSASKIDKVLSRISSGDIRIPAFQRAYVWKQNQVLELLDSIIKNYPLGSVLLWSTHEKLKHTRNIAGYHIPDSDPDYPVNYVLDGQQRLSSIYGVFSKETKQDESSADYNPDKDLFEIYYDFKDEQFKASDSIKTPNNHSIYLRNFVDGSTLIEALQNLDSKYHDAVKELYSKFINYEIPLVTIKNRSKEEVGIIFERINNTGTKLSTLDLMTAWTWTDDFHLLESINNLLEELDEKGFGDIPRNIILQAISGALQNDTTTGAILNLSGEHVRDGWEDFCESIKKAIDFCSTEINCLNSDFLPFPQQLVIIIKFYTEIKSPNAEQLKNLKKWFWVTSFSDRYSTGQTTSKMNGDIETICEFKNNKYDLLGLYSYTVSSIKLISTKFSKRNPVTRALLLLMSQFEPLDLIKATKVDIDKALSEYNRKQYHHFFPNAFLKKQGVSRDKIFSVVNFCFLPADSNKKISRKAPSDYVFNLIPNTELDKILESNLMPMNKDLYRKNKYSEFLERRADLFLTKIDELTN